MENGSITTNEWQTIEHAFAYLPRADKLPHRTEGEKALIDQIPLNAKRVLDLGTGEGQVTCACKVEYPNS